MIVVAMVLVGISTVFAAVGFRVKQLADAGQLRQINFMFSTLFVVSITTAALGGGFLLAAGMNEVFMFLSTVTPSFFR
ncbi:hypothetical protein [Candidatus Palauibacter sp.]|uniref:hypothetical protein n=1 Tax=Candidatus Palauibacter sp. TaxID=3101350 RepID=UPI003B5A3136